MEKEREVSYNYIVDEVILIEEQYIKMTYEYILTNLSNPDFDVNTLYDIIRTWKKPFVPMTLEKRLEIILRNYCIEKAVVNYFNDIKFYDNNHEELTEGVGTNNPDFIQKEGTKTAELKTAKNLKALLSHKNNWHNADCHLFYSLDDKTLYELNENNEIIREWNNLPIDNRWRTYNDKQN